MKRSVCLPALILAVALTLTSCGGGRENTSVVTTDANGSGQSITYVHSGEEVPMERTLAADTLYVGAYGENFVTSTLNSVGYNNLIAISLIYDTLFIKDFQTGEVKNGIAERYEYLETEEGLFLHIVIRPEARFQSGEPITAEDCYHSAVSRFAVLGTIRTYLGDTVNIEKSYYEGDRDLYIALNQYDRTILECLSCQWFSIANKSFEDTATDDDFWDKVDGSGPFLILEQNSGDSMLLQVDDDYWGWGITCQRPSYDYLSVKFYSESSVMMIDYENGLLDACLGLGVSETGLITSGGEAHSNLKIVSSGNYTVICLPAYNEAFSDPRVREAISCAIDTDSAAKIAYGALGITMDAYVSSMAPYRKEYQTNRYDPERARGLLREAGYEDGELELYTVVSSNDSASVTLGELVQAYLDEVGVKLTVESYDFPTAIQLQRNGSVDMCICTFYTMNSDISGCFIQLPEGSYNQAAWLTQLDARLDAKLKEGRYTDSDEAAGQAYDWVQDWLYENMWYLPVVEYNTAFICRDYVDDSGFDNLMHARDIRNLDLLPTESPALS